MIHNSENEFYAIEFSENHDPLRVSYWKNGRTPKQVEALKAKPPIYGWAIFKVKNGLKTATGLVEKTEEKARSIVDNWLRLDYESAAKAAHRAIHKANRLAELTGSDPIGAESSTKVKVKAVKVKEVPPYVWEISEADRIIARGLGIQL